MSGALDSAKPPTNSLFITNPIYNKLSLLGTEVFGPFIMIFFDMKNSSINFHHYFSLLIPGVYLSPFLGEIIIFISKTDIGKYALFMTQKMEKRFVQMFTPFQGFIWYFSEQIQT